MGYDVVVQEPKLLSSNRQLDFGQGFYTTSNQEQAVRWAEKVSIRNETNTKFLSIFQFDIESAKAKGHVLEFPTANGQWLEFVSLNRIGKLTHSNDDVVIGPVADDHVYLTVRLFETGVLNKEEAIKRLKVEKLFNQISFHTEMGLNFCTFDRYIDLGGDIYR